MESINSFVNDLNGVLFSDYVVYALLIVGVLFTVWSFFGQYRAITHGVQVIRGKYDDHDDPGAINHFQALAAALSATVGLGNIAGVAVAVALGGPGAVLWMWLIGLLGMALKMTEVTQSMLYRNTDDPENPHGGPMFVVQKGLSGNGALRLPAAVLFCLVSFGLGYVGYGVTESIVAPIIGGAFGLVFLGLGLVSGRALGTFIGGVFVITLIISAITGGNMFQAWNVGDITKAYFNVPQVVTGLILATVVGLVIIGGIKRIGSVAGRVVPVMCIIYVVAALYVLVMNAGEIPDMLLLIVKSGLPDFLGGESANPMGAFLGGTFVYTAMWGVKRALFSSEAGQGSAPIAHSAAKTDEPVREGVVAGIGPLIDTLVVCTLTALVILSSGAFNRESEATFKDVSPEVVFVSEPAGEISVPVYLPEDGFFIADPVTLPNRAPKASEVEANENDGKDLPDWSSGDSVFAYATAQPGDQRLVVSGEVEKIDGTLQLVFEDTQETTQDATYTSIRLDEQLYHGAKPAWKLSVTNLPRMTADAREIRMSEEDDAGWRKDETVFMVVEGDVDPNTGRDLRKLSGKVKKVVAEEGDQDTVTWTVEWNALESETKPSFRPLLDEDGNEVTDAEGNTLPDLGLFADYAGATLTAYAFDRVTPGLGKILVTIAVWLFAVSTMISWSYYGEQGIYYLFNRLGDAGTKSVVLVYKLVYCALILITCVLAMPIIEQADGPAKAIIGTDAELDMWTTLGPGVMLVANIPIMLIFGAQAMRAYRDYFKRMRRGDDPGHPAPPIVDVAEGKDVE